MKITVCIPMYNEIGTAADTSKQLICALEDFCSESGDTYELIFSDDGSADGCADAVRLDLPTPNGEVRIVKGEVNMGKGAAVRRAALASTGDIVMYTDCDLAYGTDVIGEAVKIMKSESCDIVAGSRAIHPEGYAGYTFIRRLASKVYVKVLTTFAGFRLSDSQCGFKVFRGELAKKIFSLAETNGWAFDFELFLLAKREGAIVREMPVTIINHRESRISVLRDSVKMLREIARIKKRVKKLDKK